MHTYATKITANSPGYLTVAEEDGRETIFEESTPGIYLPWGLFGWTGTTVEKFVDGTYRMTRKDGTKLDFDATRRLSQIQDRNGNALTLGYSGAALSTLTDAAGRFTTFEYDAQNRITIVMDPAGRVTTLGYDTNGRLSGITDPESQTTSFTYNANGWMDSKIDLAGNLTTYSYDAYGRVIGATDPSNTPVTIDYQPSLSQAIVTGRNDGITTTLYDPVLDVPLQVVAADNGVTTYNYDGNRNLLSETDALDNTTSYTYDGNGNRTSVSDALGRTTSYTYNGFGQITSVTDPEERITSYTYDSAGNLTSVTDANGAVTEYEHDAVGNVTAIIKPGGQATTFTYDSFGNLLSATAQADLTTRFTYDSVGNVVSRTDANDATTTYAYDNVNRLLRITDPEGHVTSFTYDANGNRRTVTDANGNMTTIEYNERNKPITMTDPLGKVTTYEYTFGGCSSCGATGGELLAAVIDSNGHTTSYEYDLSGRRTKVIDPLWHATFFAYDPVGNLLTKTDANGRLTVFANDPVRRLVAQTDPLTGVASFGYTPSGWLDNVVDPGGIVTRYAYDNTGRVTQVLSPDTGTTSFSYNPDGTLGVRTDANGTAVTYTYDNSARLTGVSFPDSLENISFSYDSPAVTYGKGRLTGMSDPSGAATYRYDALGRLTSEDRVVLGRTYTTSYAYDNVGNVASATYPSGRVVSYTYDALNRPASASWQKGSTTQPLATGVAYDNVGNLSSATLGNGLSSSWTFDPNNRLATTVVPGKVNLSLAYDNVGNILGITDLIRPSSTKGYTYDPLDRLAQGTGPWNLLSYTYDPNGNRLSQQNGTLTTYAFQGNRLSTATSGWTASYQYDSAGNTTSDGTRTFVYNQNQRLIRVLEGGTVKGEYIYDGHGRRTIKTAYTKQGNKTITTTTVFHYDTQGRLIGETNHSGTLVAEYVWLGERPLAMVRKAGNKEETYYFHGDQLNTPLKATDKTGAVVWDVEFDPFGIELPGGVKVVQNTLRFPGQYYDQETGLHYNYFRDYDPKVGRYIQPDPIGLAGGMNLYPYVENRPINQTDPRGLSSLLYDSSSDRIWVFDRQMNPVGNGPASNNAQRISKGPWPGGTFPYEGFKPHPDEDSNDQFGPYGIFIFRVPKRPGMGVHAGRKDRCDRAIPKRCGYKHSTNGCIRTTEEVMNLIHRLRSSGDELEWLSVVYFD
jgi:RHS repeat-associated protein